MGGCATYERLWIGRYESLWMGGTNVCGWVGIRKFVDGQVRKFVDGQMCQVSGCGTKVCQRTGNAVYRCAKDG